MPKDLVDVLQAVIILAVAIAAAASAPELRAFILAPIAEKREGRGREGA